MIAAIATHIPGLLILIWVIFILLVAWELIKYLKDRHPSWSWLSCLDNFSLLDNITTSPWLHNLYLVRIPFIGGLILFFFPIIANLTPASKFLQNLFVMDSDGQIFLVMIFAVLTSLIIMSMIKNIILRQPPQNTSDNHQRLRIILSIVLFLPTWFFLFKLNYKELLPSFILGAILGIVIWLIVSRKEANLIQDFFETLKQQQQEEEVVLPRPLEIIRNFFIGKFFINAQNTNPPEEEQAQRLRNIVYQAQLIFGFGFYLIVIMVLNFPNPQGKIIASDWQAPTLLYALLIIWVVIVVLGGVTSTTDDWFDQKKAEAKKAEADDPSKPPEYIFRVPVILLLILFSGLSYGAFKVDHYFKLTDSQVVISDYQKDFKTAIGNRLCPEDFKEEERCKKEQSLVVVAASGGGIQASGWTAQVLAGLQDEKLGIEEDFTKAIGLISSVSGGSVGTMFYLDQFNDQGFLKDPPKMIKNAQEDWLDSVGWGLAYPDLLRVIGFPWLADKWLADKYRYIDRGYSLEKDWQRSLDTGDETLDGWYKKAMDGKIPIPVFNSTLVENGRRFFISPMKFIPKEMRNYLNDFSNTEFSDEEKQKIRESKALDFRTLYNCGTPEKPKSCNLDVISAARLSATFPYVSPMARNYIEKENNNNGDNIIQIKDPKKDKQIKIPQNYHMADGGFFDNAGAFTAIEWINDFLEYKPEDKSECQEENYKCLNIKKVVLLQINAFPESELKSDQKGNLGFLTVLAGPFSALNGVRDSTQVARNIQAVKLLEDKWNNNGKDISIEHFTISFPQKNANGEEYNQPLSWRLTQTQKNNLKEAWEKDDTIRDEVKRMKEFWNKVSDANPEEQECIEIIESIDTYIGKLDHVSGKLTVPGGYITPQMGLENRVSEAREALKALKTACRHWSLN